MIHFRTRGEDEDDFLNARRERNSENTENWEYNCGGFALGTYSWYFPYDEEEREVEVDNLYFKGKTDEEISLLFLDEDLAWMVEEFRGRLRVLESINDIKPDERLIAYRVGFDSDWGESEGCLASGYDFHFRFWLDDVGWVEKCGCGTISECELDDPWECGGFVYTSPIKFLALKEI